MILSLSKVKRTLDVLASRMKHTLFTIDKLTACEVDDYKSSNTPPDGDYIPFRTVDGTDKRFWIKADFTTPEPVEGYEYSLQISTGISGWDALNPQMIFYINGQMREGLDVNHRTVHLEPSTEYNTYCYLYSGSWTSHFDVEYSIVATSIGAEALYYDMLVPYEACRDVYPEGSREYAETMAILDGACNLLDIRAGAADSFEDGVDKAGKYIKAEYYDKLCSTIGKPIVSCVGHTHIDVEWQWDRRQTREKMQRSASTALSLMERYPEYLFMLSQPELYRYLKEEAPEKYAELAKRIADGRWEADGALYLECDCNLISGESMVRQLMYGKEYFRKEFGKESRVCFLPDVFGYSAAMPQILKGADVDYFVTSKISWNDTNTMPYDAFMWRGIDGSEVFASFITGQRTKKGEEPRRNTSYVGEINPAFIDGAWARFKQKEYTSRTLNTYGHGDGGGGPTREMLEYARRLSHGLPRLPVAKLTTLREHLDLMYKEFCESADRLKYTPRWVGELYLEYHRGTYTTMSRNKRGNRKGELALGLCEALFATEELLGYEADKEGLYTAWQSLLHNQFHDILPGSSIGSVYDFTRRDYAYLKEFTNEKCKQSLTRIAKNLNTDAGILIYNPSGFDRCGSFRLGDSILSTSETIPAFGYKVVTDATSDSSVRVDGHCIESDRYKIVLDESGRFVSLLDKEAMRDLVPCGALMNEWQVYEDYPLNYDAWDIEEYTARKPYVLSDKAEIAAISDGARAGLQVKHSYMSSTITEKIWLYDSSPRIDLECQIDWKEHNQLVKLLFPTDIHSSEIECDIQFGHISRPTHDNTSWDLAKFEICAHKWVDISEHGYGLAILNDSKYGLSARDGVIGLTCLKSPTFPYENAGIDIHEFTYSLLPHTGDLCEGGVIKEAYALNQPLVAMEVEAGNGSLSDEFSLIGCDNDAVIIETVKPAENGKGIIVRMYETFGGRAKCKVKIPSNIISAYKTNLIERDIEPIAIKDSLLHIELKPFEIYTLRLEF